MQQIFERGGGGVGGSQQLTTRSPGPVNMSTKFLVDQSVWRSRPLNQLCGEEDLWDKCMEVQISGLVKVLLKEGTNIPELVMIDIRP